ncbi:MAG: hypothetical protein IT460_18520 [Planctomycetes bacterium]|nr:hypothetical protein [Planctomycetota bacterium]
MSGNGGHKHRNKRLQRRRAQARRLGKENVARVRTMFEAKGQAWDPAKNSVQAQALNHAGRREAFRKALPA